MLSRDLIIEILLWLPVKSLVRFQSVSKSWRGLIKDPNFIEMHLQRSSQTLSERILVLHSRQSVLQCWWDEYCWKFFRSSSIPEWVCLTRNHCNGLFCGYDYKNEIVIWNPSIRKHMKISPVKPDAFNFHAKLFNVGIGYDLVNNDYKVVNIVKLFKSGERIVVSEVLEVLVYSLKENSWRRVEDKWPLKDLIIGVGTYLNGNMNWLVEIEELSNNQTVLVAFDLTNEKFQVHPIPVKYLSLNSLKVLGGKLCACTSHEVWMMEEYKVASSWSLLYSFKSSDESLLHMQPFFRCNPIVISKDGQEILMVSHKESFWYDRQKKTQRNEKILDIPKDYRATPSQGSLLLIDGNNDDDYNMIFFLNSEV